MIMTDIQTDKIELERAITKLIVEFENKNPDLAIVNVDIRRGDLHCGFNSVLVVSALITIK